jgi:ATP-dependent Lon protease
MATQNKNIFYLKKKVIFPFCTNSLMIKKTSNSLALKIHEEIIAYPIRSIIDILLPKNKIGTLAEITEIEDKIDKLRLMLQGIDRIVLKKISKLQLAEYETLEIKEHKEIKEMREILIKKSQQLIFLINVNESDRLISLVNYLQNTSQAVDFIANYFILDFKKRFKIYYQIDIQSRLSMVLADIEHLIHELMIKMDGTT